MPYTHRVDELWYERLGTQPRTQRQFLTDHQLHHDYHLAKAVLVNVWDATVELCGTWQADQIARSVIAKVIDDQRIDQVGAGR